MLFNSFVSWPSAPLTESLVLHSVSKLGSQVVTSLPSSTGSDGLLQWSTYDDIDHEQTLLKSESVLASSYTIRKALIRKHFLHRCAHSYTTKHPSSLLSSTLPRTWDVEISFADELDEMWADELWDLGKELDQGEKWWILKPGMADRGQGIRLFNTKESLREIFESFEDDSDELEGRDVVGTNVVASQLRHFVIQEYLSNPLLLDPLRIPHKPSTQVTGAMQDLRGRKFHLRAYCVASGALKVYLFTKILALFSSEPYTLPSEGANLAPHLTNTSLQQHCGEEGVRLLDELAQCQMLSGDNNGSPVTTSDLKAIADQISDILAEVFSAALESPVHFQPLPNAFELYGVDFLVTHPAPRQTEGHGFSERLHVTLLEINAEPAIELTGPRLTWILEELFLSIGEVCVKPFFKHGVKPIHVWEVGETRHGLKKCLDIQVRGGGTSI